ncbi:hypothetical protein QQF64_001011 [Cirrhinus molitorella]|uniref:Ig-like domain-containing protein n=1 Tax=Cirrhinus molitorella TaxID=172907 RepID=A0ABR3NYT6_9TELE
MIILVTFLVLMCVSVSGTTDESEINCGYTITVPRNTVFLAPVTTMLKINCTIVLHGCHRKPRVSWCKLYGNGCKALNYSDHMRTEWKTITENHGMDFLIFLNISIEDAGFYRCKKGDTSIGHAINVTVTANNKNDEFLPTLSNTMSTTVDDLKIPPKDDLQWFWYFVYIGSGIVGLVFIVMTVTFLYGIRRQGRKSVRKDMEKKNQYMGKQKNGLLLPPHLYLDSDLITSVVYHV